MKTVLPYIYRGHEDSGFFAHALSLSPEASPLEMLPDNQRTGGARYACLVSVRDYFRMRASAIRSGEWHYSRMEPEILADARSGRAIIVFDLCNEGPAYEPDIFSEIYAWIERNRLPAGRCVWLAQNRVIGAAARADASDRASLVRFECYDYFVKIMAWIFSPISPENSLGVDPETHIQRMFDASRKDRLLLCLNATPRLSRVLTVAALRHHGLMKRSIVSFPGMTYPKTGASLTEVLDFLEKNPRLNYLRPAIEEVVSMPPLRADAFIDQGNALVERIDPFAYERSFFSLVTESDFAEKQIERVTEKTVKAFCMGHPTVIVGNPHSIELMTEFGFKDWPGIVNRQSDAVEDPANRFESTLEEIVRVVSNIESDPQGWLDASREAGEYNFRYAVNGNFLGDFVKRVDRPLVETLASLVNH